MSNDELLDEYIDYAFSSEKDILTEQDKKNIATTLGFVAYKFQVEWNKFVEGSIKQLKETFDMLCTEDGEYLLSSTEIRQQLKHEKNPMRIKQLNRELNKAFKRERGRK